MKDVYLEDIQQQIFESKKENIKSKEEIIAIIEKTNGQKLINVADHLGIETDNAALQDSGFRKESLIKLKKEILQKIKKSNSLYKKVKFRSFDFFND